MNSQKTNLANRVWITSILSLISSVITSIILHPLDIVKTRQQVAATSNGAIIAFPSLFSSIKHIHKTEGFSGLYKGLSGQVIASGTSWFVFRYLFDLIRYKIEEINSEQVNTFELNNGLETIGISIKSNLIATTIAGIASTALVHPLWLVKTRLEIQSVETKRKGWKQYSSGIKGFIECLNSIYRKDGISGLYSGFIPTLLLVPQSTIQFVIYDALRNKCNISNSIISNSIYFFLLGFISKLFASVLTYPLQVLRTRIQMCKLEKINSKFEVFIFKFKYKEFVHFTKNHMYPGLMTHVPKVCIQNAIMSLIYETMLKTTNLILLS